MPIPRDLDIRLLELPKLEGWHSIYQTDYKKPGRLDDSEIGVFQSKYSFGTAISRWFWYEPVFKKPLNGKSSHWSQMKIKNCNKLWKTFIGSSDVRDHPGKMLKQRKKEGERGYGEVCSVCRSCRCGCPEDPVILPRIMPELVTQDYDVDPDMLRFPRGVVNARATKGYRFWPPSLGSPNTDARMLGVGDRLVVEMPSQLGKARRKFNSTAYGVR